MWKDAYSKWKSFESLDEEIREALVQIENNEKSLEDAFYKNLEFGTGGMRGEIGPGTNRMNVYTIRKASQGLAEYICSHGQEAMRRGVAIAYDSRHKSPEFAMESARTLASNGIVTYVFDELRPTPELSFAVRHLNAFAGIVITASHNPPEYNGYKVYGEDGAQLPPAVADEVIGHVNQVENELAIEVKDESELKEQGLINMIGGEVDRAYLDKLMTILEHPEIGPQSDVTVVFSPLHGTASYPVNEALKMAGYGQVYTVKEQEQPDPDFSTVASPNPEEQAAFELAIRDGKKHNADLLIATDPDADRLGIAVKDENGEYTLLTGNQTGALLFDYILSQKQSKGTLPDDGVAFKTIVTSELGRKIGEAYGVPVADVLTGFKFIGEKIAEHKKAGTGTFVFGYEESYGYLVGDFARDKDAVQAAILAVEACAYYKAKGLSLLDALTSIYERFGYYREGLKSLTLKGKEGADLITGILARFRENPPADIAGLKVIAAEDYKKQERTELDSGRKSQIHLPASNVLKYFLEEGSWICLRPSGTEPKIKFYFGTKASSEKESSEKLEQLTGSFMHLIDRVLNP